MSPPAPKGVRRRFLVAAKGDRDPGGDRQCRPGDVVPTLEVMARRAGLLGEHQRITHAKLFRAAKKNLGIMSRRAGFGSRSQWLWKLPRQNTTSLKPEP